MGRATMCLRNIFTKSTTQINKNDNHNTKYYKPKWITGLLKSCKDTNISRTANSVVTSSKPIATGSENNEPSAIVSLNKAVAVAPDTAAEVVRVIRSDRLDYDPSRRAAVVIQSVFRGYLARKALRALRALVRLQALVRGYIVRKQAKDHVRKMEALIRAQARARANRAVPVPSSSYSSSRTSHSCILDPLTPEYTSYYESQECSPGHDQNQRCSVKSEMNSLPDQFKLGSRRASSARFIEEKVDKIVEVESSAKPYNSTKGKNLFVPSDYISHNSYRYRTPGIPYPAEDLYLQYSNEIDRFSFYTADDITPPSHTGSFRSSSSRRGGLYAPANVNCSESYLGDHPNYMAYTKSSKAKMRSLSAPRQRTQLDRSTSHKCNSSHDYASRRLSSSGVI